jgi:predicted ATPase/class 3 adenylate cyclase/DNA-binding NarL/FixJ family response regulator
MTGTATFLLTGVEMSTLLWEMAPDAAAAAIARHYELVDAAVAGHDGTTSGAATPAARSGARSEPGDSVLAVFASPSAAVAAAQAIQLALAAETWPEGMVIRVRIGLYTGEVRGDQSGAAVASHRCARLREVAHGGQTLLSSATAALVADALPEGSWLADLGVHRLRDLSRPEHLYELRHQDLPHEFPPVRSLDVIPNNLPAQLTSFVGRDGELAEVMRVLADQRLVTLAGAGGCGKTRLAVQAAAGLADRWPDGVWWVDLGSATEPELVARLTAAALRVLVEPASGPLQALASQLRGRRLLLCLDTCEHLLDACAELAGTVLRACPEVSIVTTSREPLGVPGETVWRVPSLVEDEAVRLFTDRAALVRPGFNESADEPAVRTVCRRLDGIPLAIELAAAWVRALSPRQIAAAMDDRFQLLAGGSRGVVARHRTLAASMAWSHDLLDPADQVVFRRLAAFSGGFTLDAARSVCNAKSVASTAARSAGVPSGPGQGADGGDVLAAIGRLVDKSLISVTEHGGEARYRMLDTIRQYAEDRLDAAGESAATRDRHLDFFLAFAERAEPQLERDQDRWRAVLATEHDNLRTALQWGLAAEDPERGRRLAAAAARFWFLHGHVREGLGLLRQAIALAPDEQSTLQGRLLAGLAMLSLVSGPVAPTVAAAERGLAVAIATDDASSRARCVGFSGYGPLYRDHREAVRLGEEAQRYGAEAGDLVAEDFGRVLQAAALTIGDRHEEAVARARVVVERCLPRAERFCAVFARESEAYAALLTGDVRSADAFATDAVRIAEPLGDYFTVGHAISNLAWVKCVAGEIDAGRQLMEPVVRSIEDAGPDIEVPLMALSQAKLRLAGGDLTGALDWFERAARFTVPEGDNWVVVRALPGLAGVLRRLGRRAEARERAEYGVAMGRRLDTPHPLAEALEELASVTAPDDPVKAEDLHHEALAVRVRHGLRTFYVDSLEALAWLAAESGACDEATRLLAACAGARRETGYPRPAINQPDHDAVVASLEAALGEEAFAAAWSQGAELSLEGAVAYATRARGSRGRPASGWASLTPTELEVIRLVVDGLTNPAIGNRLFMSRATVKTHLSHVYTKLGLANRTELATFAGGRLVER